MILDKRRPVFHLVRPLEIALSADSSPAGLFPAAIFAALHFARAWSLFLGSFFFARTGKNVSSQEKLK
jgi:hypothetical protein